MAATTDCAEGRHDVCRGAGPNYYCPQTAHLGDQVCACRCHRRMVELPLYVWALLVDGFDLAGDGGIDPFTREQRKHVEDHIASLRLAVDSPSE